MNFKTAICLFVATLISSVALNADDSITGISDANSKPLDTIHLRSGAEINGTVVSEIKNESDGRTYVVVKTESGGQLTLDSGRLIRKIEYADRLDDEYLRRLKIAGDDPDLNWKVYRWCQEQPSGGHRFKDELRFLLERISVLDANDERARRLLGYDLVDGKWVLQSSLYAAYGYRKVGAAWAPELQATVDEKLADLDQLTGSRKRDFAQWLSNVNGPNPARIDLTKQLFSICDEVAVPIIFKREAKTEQNPKLRLLYVEAFGRVPSFAANQALCFFAIEDPVDEIRERALTLLGQPHFDHEASAAMLAGHLAANDSLALKRAAFAIGELGAFNSLINLVDALETKHIMIQGGQPPGGMSTTFGDGGTGMQTGGQPVKIEQMVKNDEVRRALRKITNQDFGFDKSAWKNWYLQNYTLHDARVRADN